MDLILASTSRYRKALLERLGIPFDCVSPKVDESAFKAQIRDPDRLALELAKAKAHAISRDHPTAVIIGGDQVAACDGGIFDKPGTRQGAIQQLAKLAGKTHRLYTAIAVWREGEFETILDVAVLKMRALTSDEIERYVAADSPLDCAGGYKIESRGIALFEAIESADHTAIEGIPLIALATLLRRIGFQTP